MEEGDFGRELSAAGEAEGGEGGSLMQRNWEVKTLEDVCEIING